MELITAYLFNWPPIGLKNIDVDTFHELKKNGWYSDVRAGKKFRILTKRIAVENKWYRVLIRFESNGKTDNGYYSFKLSLPCPFLVTECTPLDDGLTRWKDIETYHGKKLGNVITMIEAGVPVDVIQEVFDDLQRHTKYMNV